MSKDAKNFLVIFFGVLMALLVASCIVSFDKQVQEQQEYMDYLRSFNE